MKLLSFIDLQNIHGMQRFWTVEPMHKSRAQFSHKAMAQQSVCGGAISNFIERCMHQHFDLKTMDILVIYASPGKSEWGA